MDIIYMSFVFLWKERQKKKKNQPTKQTNKTKSKTKQKQKQTNKKSNKQTNKQTKQITKQNKTQKQNKTNKQKSLKLGMKVSADSRGLWVKFLSDPIKGQVSFHAMVIKSDQSVIHCWSQRLYKGPPRSSKSTFALKCPMAT